MIPFKRLERVCFSDNFLNFESLKFSKLHEYQKIPESFFKLYHVIQGTNDVTNDVLGSKSHVFLVIFLLTLHKNVFL